MAGGGGGGGGAGGRGGGGGGGGGGRGVRFRKRMTLIKSVSYQHQGWEEHFPGIQFAHRHDTPIG